MECLNDKGAGTFLQSGSFTHGFADNGMLVFFLTALTTSDSPVRGGGFGTVTSHIWSTPADNPSGVVSIFPMDGVDATKVMIGVNNGNHMMFDVGNIRFSHLPLHDQSYLPSNQPIGICQSIFNLGIYCGTIQIDTNGNILQTSKTTTTFLSASYVQNNCQVPYVKEVTGYISGLEVEWDFQSPEKPKRVFFGCTTGDMLTVDNTGKDNLVVTTNGGFEPGSIFWDRRDYIPTLPPFPSPTPSPTSAAVSQSLLSSAAIMATAGVGLLVTVLD